jgi:two-component system NtrC family sensor kinase
MTPEVQAHLFERSLITKGVGRGSGQGPAIAHDAVAAHAGEIKIDSTVGMGTTFTIVLPLVPPEQEDAGDE